MEYKVESSLWDFPAWSGGKDTLKTLQEKGDCEEVEQLIDELFFDSDTTDTDINDFLWFERDTIAERLGYRDWGAYEEGRSESDLEDAEEWFSDSELDFLAELAGINREDYVNGEDDDDFVDAIQNWWDGLTDAKKVEIYYQNE